MGVGEWVWRRGEREIVYLSLHCHHQNDSCIKMGSDESHFNVSVRSDGQCHKTVSTNHKLSEEKGEPKRYRTRSFRLPPNARWEKREIIIIPTATLSPHRMTFCIKISSDESHFNVSLIVRDKVTNKTVSMDHIF